jgi:hypothetical protein
VAAGIGLGALEILGGEAVGAQRVDERHGVAVRSQGCEQVLPVMAGGLHGHQHLAGWTEKPEELGIARGVFVEGRRLQAHLAALLDPCDDMRFGSDVDSRKSHETSLRRRKSGASVPEPMPALVHARTGRRRPRDTVRAAGSGRGRQSHSRGLRLERVAATLSRIPSTSFYTGVIR